MTKAKPDPQSEFINRELSLLAFNRRVLKQAQNEDLPLLQRLRFLFICSNNLDEFFEVRVAGLKEQRAFGTSHSSPDSWHTDDLLKEISRQTHKIVDKVYTILQDDLLPALRSKNVYFLLPGEWNKQQKKWLQDYFHNEILPIISPIALDFAHPFPRLVNKSLNFIVSLEGQDAFGRPGDLAVVHAPRSIPRVIAVPEELRTHKDEFFFLTNIISAFVHEIFPGMKVTGCYQFRITRNSDLFLDEEEVEDLALAVKTSLLSRSYGNAVRLEIAEDCPQEIAEYLLDKHHLTENDMYRVNGPVNLSRFMKGLGLMDRPELRYPRFTPGLPQVLERKNNLFEAIRQGDILFHHPFQSFEPVVELIRQATVDPNVLTIKQTLYRTGVESQMVQALIDAARAGKEVTAVIELRARFDEASNIELATQLQEAGVLVVFGVVGYKTHAKMTLIVRREQKQLRYYVHLSSGNYHARTAKEYTDIGLMTYDQVIGDDIKQIFQQLTGIGQEAQTQKILHSPFVLDKALHRYISQEEANAKAGKPAHIMAKMNALTDSHIIKALYLASQAGVKIDLIVRGVCSLRPGVPGLSDNIQVRSIVGRFLEHSRVFYFLNGGDEIIYSGSADWMERNLYHRVEVCFPIEDEALKQQIKQDCLLNYLADNTESWALQADGSYKRVKRGKKPPHSAQETLLGNYGER
ncbi:MAG: polyphosphate kinase 1 [Legionellales bacterium]|nr:polyphosphate kinase 1 [Legionellales bacterium]|tara:strand:- start:30493 stop:32565 length:2073 start_codon:yes stop_codon:yes gene_type:complete